MYHVLAVSCVFFVIIMVYFVYKLFENDQPKCRLTYCDAKALGEPVRYMLSYMGIEFEDHRVRTDNMDFKLKDLIETEFGGTPILEREGTTYSQTSVILRHLAEEAGLAGRNEHENQNIEMIVDTFIHFQLDVVYAYVQRINVRKLSRNARWRAQETIERHSIPDYMKEFEEAFKNGGYLANGKLSWADIYVVAYCESLPGLMKIDLADKYPFFKTLRDKVHSQPGIKKWIKKRPKTSL